MEDVNSICTANSVYNTTCTKKQCLSEFIKTWESYPELWNTSIDAYRDKSRKNNALDKLLEIYKKIKPHSTREDIKKKLNSLRTNFRKELKKIHKSKLSGKSTDEVYVPTSWIYYELLFLSNDEQPVKKTTEENKENNEDQHRYSISSMDPISTPVTSTNKRKKDNDQQGLLERTLSLLERDNSECQEEYYLAKVWATKLKKLEPTQKLFAEKAINDILFEAQLGKLNKNSVKVNEHLPYTSSPGPHREALDHSRINYIPSPSPSPNTQESALSFSSTPFPRYIYTNEHVDNTMRPPKALTKPPNFQITTGTPSQIILRPPLTYEHNVSQDTMSQESTQNVTSNVISVTADVHAEYSTPEENLTHFFQSFE